jgi:hypothetical protein
MAHTIACVQCGLCIVYDNDGQSRKRKRDDKSMQKSLNNSMKSMSQLSASQAAVP